MNHPCPNCGSNKTRATQFNNYTFYTFNYTAYKKYKCDKCGKEFIHDTVNKEMTPEEIRKKRLWEAAERRS